MPKGLPDFLLPQPFYERIDDPTPWPPRPGQICWARVTYPYQPPKALEFVRGSYNAFKGEAQFKIRTLKRGDVTDAHMPIPELGLQDDETLIIQRAKERRVVVLSDARAAWHPKDPGTTYQVAPCYTFKERHAPKFVLEVQAFLHAPLFYMPPSEGVEESALRLDLVQPASLGALRPVLVDGTPLRVSDDASRYLVYRIGCLLTGQGTNETIEGDLKSYRELLLPSSK